MEEGGGPGGATATGAGAGAGVGKGGGPVFSTCASRRPSKSATSSLVTWASRPQPASWQHSAIQSCQSCGMLAALVP